MGFLLKEYGSFDAILKDQLFQSPRFFENPHPYYQLLQESTPIVWYPPYDCWVFTKYNDVKNGLQNTEFSAYRLDAFFSMLPSEHRHRFVELESFYNSWLMFTDPPMHRKLKSAVGRTFSPQSTQLLSRDIENYAQDLLVQINSQTPVDLLHEFSVPLSVKILAQIMGLDTNNYQLVSDLSTELVAFLGGALPQVETAEAALESLARLKVHLNGIFTEKRANPSEDLISLLVAADTLTEDEIFAICANLLVDGHEPVSNSICNSLYTLLSFPDQYSLLRSNPNLISSAVEESLRYEPPFTYAARRATRDITFGTTLIKQDQIVMFMLIAANRDASIFNDSQTFDITRTEKNLAFGWGTHYCLGAALGKLITEKALLAVTNNLTQPSLQNRTATWKKSSGFRAMENLWVSLT